MQTEAQGEGSAFLMGKALGFFSNHIRRFKQEVDDRDYFNIIGEVMGREQILDAIGQALETRGIPLPEGFGENKNDEEMHGKVLPKIKNPKDLRILMMNKHPLQTVPEMLDALWTEKGCRDASRQALVDMVEVVRSGMVSGAGEKDLFGERFQELSRLFELSENEQDVLLLAHLLHAKVLETPGRERSHDGIRKMNKLLPWLNLSQHQLRRILSTNQKLRRYQLIDEDLDYNDHFDSFLYGLTDEPLSEQFYARLKGEALPWNYYGSLAEKHGETLKALIRSRNPNRGFHVLLYGVPGSGKSSFAQSLAAELGLIGYGISQDIQNDNTERTCSSPEFRFGALRLCDDRVDREKSLLVVDEADDMLRRTSGGGLFALLGGGSTAVGDKGLLNNLLDEVKTPCLWISNTSAGELDPSSRRRFDYSIRFDKLTAAQRRAIWKNNVEKYSLGGLFPEGLQEKLAEKYEVSAGGISLVLKNLADVKPEAAECEKWVEKLMAPHCELLGIQTDKSKWMPAADYSLEGLNIRGDLPLERVVEAIRRFRKESEEDVTGGMDRPRMNLLLSGPPGTGKTEFVKYLGAALGSKVVVRMGSDILSMWVGGTEKNIRRAFEEAEAEKAILFFDEIDGLLQDRGMAHQSWEVTQVNELLHRMETFNGVMVGATNHWNTLDPAVARRFTFKLEFGFLEEEGKRQFFERTFRTKLTQEEAERLARIPDLAPGDYRTVRQGMYYLGGDAKNVDRLAALERESETKGKNRYSTKKIGF